MDQRRLLLAVLLSLVVAYAWNEIVVKPRQHAMEAPAATPTTVPHPDGDRPVAPAAAPPVPSGEAGDLETKLSFEVGTAAPIVVETERWIAKVTPQGGRLASASLKGFRQTVDADSPPLELVAASPLLPLTLDFETSGSDASVLYQSSSPSLQLADGATGELVLTGQMPSGLQIQKRLRFLGNSYLFDVDVSVTGGSVPPAVSLVIPQPEQKGFQGTGTAHEVAVVLSGAKLTETPIDLTKIKELKVERKSDAVWGGFSVPFFFAAVIAPAEPLGTVDVEPVGSRPIVAMRRPLEGGKTSFKLFLGPKSKEVLADAGFELSRTLDFGWFWFIAIPMLYALRLLHRITGNYGVDIILLTGLVRAATIPLTQKSFRSMKEMQKLQPQLKRIQEQYKDDQTRLQKEMMDLYKRHGVNPFSGCAPMLLQIPIFVGLYNALLHAIELRHAPFALWITDLSSPERLVVAGLGIPVLTILMGGTMIVQQWLTPQQGDPTQRQMMMLMPVVFTFMFLNFPSGLVLYWLVSNVLGIAQQYLMLRSPT
jgi:YidC/Oxa1 family membrane protein insertase